MREQVDLIVAEDDLATLRNCGGYYICPEGPGGELLGPLVGYAGTYEAPDGKKQFVGKVYYNFAKAEENPPVMRHYARKLINVIGQTFPDGIDYVMAMPMGGIVIGVMVAEMLGCWFVLAEKEVTKVKTETAREESKLKLDRHDLKPNCRVIIFEDVCNNFSTTEKGRELVEQAGSQVVGLACIMNRSPQADYQGLPVVSMLHLPTEQFRQDDPKVAVQVAAGRVEWKPKKKESWERLTAAMNTAAAAK